MDKDEIFRKYVLDACNNIPMVDAVVDLHKEAGTDDSDMFAEALYTMIPSLELCQAICQIRDLVFDLGTSLEVEPGYEDASVEYEARPKHPTGCGIIEINPDMSGMRSALDSARQNYSERVFNPITTEFRPKSEYRRLEDEIFRHH